MAIHVCHICQFGGVYLRFEDKKMILFRGRLSENDLDRFLQRILDEIMKDFISDIFLKCTYTMIFFENFVCHLLINHQLGSPLHVKLRFIYLSTNC